MTRSSVSALIAADCDELLDFAAELIAIPSVTGDEAAVAEHVERWLEREGFDTERHFCTEADLVRWPVYAAERDLATRPSIVGHLRSPGARVPPLVLNGHLDVVPPGPAELWSRDPFSGARAGGRLHGRGASDMKAGIAAALFAMRAARRTGIELPFDVQFQGVIAEESGGLGTLSLLAARDEAYSAAIVLEPSSSKVVAACGGAAPFTVSVEGQAAHISIPWTGVSALDKLIAVYQALQQLERDRAERLSHPLFDSLPQKAALAIGVVEAGEWRLTVPGSARMLGRIGALPAETIAGLRAEVAAAIESAARADEWLREHPPHLTWDGAGFAGWETPESHPLVSSMRAAAAALGGDASQAAQTYGSDAGKFADRGVPVTVIGPGDLEQAHATDESVAEDDVVYVAQLVGDTIMRLGEEWS